MILALGGEPSAQTYVPPLPNPAADPCFTHPSGAACRGLWQAPEDLCISCHSTPNCGQSCKDQFGIDRCLRASSPPGTILGGDEIVHATLIPVDGVVDQPTDIDHTGHVLVWTRCSKRSFRQPPTPPYKSWIWDPVTSTVYHGPRFEGPSNDAYGLEDPFCAGHTWMLDDAGDPKFLVVGGADLEAQPNCFGQPPGSNQAAWFDPLADFTNWLDGPPDFSTTETLWYPSVITYKDPGNDRFLPMIVGGVTCFNGGGAGQLYDTAWTYTPSTDTWCTADLGDYLWHLYPRLFQLSNGDILSVGHQTGQEDPDVHYDWPDQPFTWGGNPINAIDVASPCSHTHSEGPDPNFVPGTSTEQWEVGGLNYCNAVILHTLKPAWYWVPPEPESIDLTTFYDMDRVILTGGSVDRVRPNAPATETNPPAQKNTLEFLNAPGEPWRLKAEAALPRIFGNFVLLPDRTILLAGGQNQGPLQGLNNLEPIYYSQSELFDPGGPTGLGSWKRAAVRKPWPQPSDPPIFRGYHSVALLLKNGSVALMGGFKDSRVEFQDNESNDTVEVYKPPYFFPSVKRPKILSSPSGVSYGDVFCVSVSAPEQIIRACVIGIGSATHHFDYGQRYIELMVNPTTCASGNLEVRAPPLATMAPEGYYLFFVVASDADGKLFPSEGEFMKLSF